MKDLPRGPIGAHIVQLSTFIALSTTFQTLYFLADLYFVGRLGKEAIAGVAVAGNLTMLVLALTQSLGVGATSLIAQAIGRKDRRQAEVLFNQSLVLSNLVGLGFGVAVFALRHAYSRWLAAGVGCAAVTAYFRRPSNALRCRAGEWRPRPRLWAQMLRIGLPAGGEFALIFGYMILVYDIIRPFGAAAQAGFGIGARVMQSLFLPTVAIAFATAPVAGQNYGARQGHRVRQAFYSAAAMSAAIMATLTLLCHVAPASMIRFFNPDPAVVAFG